MTPFACCVHVLDVDGLFIISCLNHIVKVLFCSINTHNLGVIPFIVGLLSWPNYMWKENVQRTLSNGFNPKQAELEHLNSQFLSGYSIIVRNEPLTNT